MLQETSQMPIYMDITYKINALKAALAFLSMLVSVFLFVFIVYGLFSSDTYAVDKSSDKLNDFINKIDTLDTLSVNFDKFPADKNLAFAANAQAVQNKIRMGNKLSSKTVLPVKIYIEDLHRTLKVGNPTSTNIEVLNKGLKKAVLRYPGTATLNELSGNIIIFGHSSHLPQDRVFNPMYRAFNGIEKLKKGARIILTGDDGSKYVYRVSKIWKAKAGEDYIHVKTLDKKLTLVTCDNFGAKEDRWIVEADFVVKL